MGVPVLVLIVEVGRRESGREKASQLSMMWLLVLLGNLPSRAMGAATAVAALTLCVHALWRCRSQPASLLLLLSVFLLFT